MSIFEEMEFIAHVDELREKFRLPFISERDMTELRFASLLWHISDNAKQIYEVYGVYDLPNYVCSVAYVNKLMSIWDWHQSGKSYDDFINQQGNESIEKLKSDWMEYVKLNALIIRLGDNYLLGI